MSLNIRASYVQVVKIRIQGFVVRFHKRRICDGEGGLVVRFEDV